MVVSRILIKGQQFVVQEPEGVSAFIFSKCDWQCSGSGQL